MNHRVKEKFKNPFLPRQSQKINANLRASEILPDALMSVVLLKKRHNRYSTTRIASQFLVSKSPPYQGDIISHTDNLWKNWSGLDKVMLLSKVFLITLIERHKETSMFSLYSAPWCLFKQPASFPAGYLG